MIIPEVYECNCHGSTCKIVRIITVKSYCFKMKGLKGNLKKPRHFNQMASTIPPNFLPPFANVSDQPKDDRLRKRGEHQYTKFKGPYENEFMR